MKTHLSGMPECKIALNDKLSAVSTQAKRRPSETIVELDDLQFHQCVRLSQFESEGVIVFVPPDGEFKLMK
jgi:AP-2 complex subunit mu-1